MGKWNVFIHPIGPIATSLFTYISPHRHHPHRRSYISICLTIGINDKMSILARRIALLIGISSARRSSREKVLRKRKYQEMYLDAVSISSDTYDSLNLVPSLCLVTPSAPQKRAWTYQEVSMGIVKQASGDILMLLSTWVNDELTMEAEVPEFRQCA